VPCSPHCARMRAVPAMKRDRDGRFRPRVGPPRARGDAKSQRFIGRVIRASSRSGKSLGYRAARARPGARLGRGYAAARLAARALGPRSRRVIVKVRIVQHAQIRPASLKDNLDYIERDGVQPDGSPSRLEAAEHEEIDAESFARRIEPDRHHFKIIVSPEDGAQIGDLKSYTRELMAQVERDLGTRLEWVATDHWDTDNPHIHILLRGKDEAGEDLVIAGDYIAHGMRHRAAEVATRWLGPRTEREMRESLTREVEQERWTSLDRTLQQSARGGTLDLAGLSSAVQDREHQALLVGRLQRLGEFGLAERVAPNRWQLSREFEPLLRAMGERGDIIRRMQRAFGGERRELATFGDSELPKSITGRLAAKGLVDPLNDRGYLIVDGIDGRAYHIGVPSRVDLSGLPIGAIVTVSNGPKPRPADRTIAELVHDGIYRTFKHLAVARSEDRLGRDPGGFVEAHVRRLEALRRAGIVERLEEGVWRVPGDLVERGRAYDLRRLGGMRVETRSYLPIERQMRAIGATWLDRLLMDHGDEIPPMGFGSEVRAALAEREEFLIREGLAERSGNRLALARNLLATLRARELESVAAKIQAESGRIYRPVPDGVPISGTFTRSVLLASGRFAMLDDGMGFSLIPWRPLIEGYAGQFIAATTRGDHVSWSLPRRRGVSR
jgi:type IV secretory pathway VirD2 relaxase